MIIIRGGKRSKEAGIALDIAGYVNAKVYVNYPIKGHTRKVYKKELYEVTNGLI